MNLVQMLQNKGILVESPRSIESMDLEKKFEHAISWNIVRNAFFNVKLSRETINFLKSNEVDFVDFLRMMRERGWCLAQRGSRRRPLRRYPDPALPRPGMHPMGRRR